MMTKVSNEWLAEMQSEAAKAVEAGIGDWQFKSPIVRCADAHSIFTELLSLRNAQSEAVAYWAVHSVTGAHIGLWEDETYARNVLKEYAGGTITPLYTHPAPPLAVTDEMVDIRVISRAINKLPRQVMEVHDNNGDVFVSLHKVRAALTAALEAKQ